MKFFISITISKPFFSKKVLHSHNIVLNLGGHIMNYSCLHVKEMSTLQAFQYTEKLCMVCIAGLW